MAWIDLGSYTVTYDWQFTSEVTGEIFRISHLNPETSLEGKKTLRGVISPSFKDDSQTTNIYDSRLFVWKKEKDVFSAYFPDGIGSHSLGFKRLDSNSEANWKIKVEAWVPLTQEEDLSNYLLSRFGDIINLLATQTENIASKIASEASTEISSNINTEELVQKLKECIMTITSQYVNAAPSIYEQVPNFQAVDVTDGQAQLILPRNPSRRRVTIRSSGRQEMTLGFTVDEDNKLVEYWEVVPKKGRYELQSSPDGSIYVGDIYAMPEFTGTIYICEFTKGELLE